MSPVSIRSVLVSPLVLFLLAASAHSAAELDVKETPLGLTRKVLIKSLTPSPDGKRLAYASVKGKGVELVVDGKPDPTDYQGVAENGIAFSPDSKHVAFPGRRARGSGLWS